MWLTQLDCVNIGLARTCPFRCWFDIKLTCEKSICWHGAQDLNQPHPCSGDSFKLTHAEVHRVLRQYTVHSLKPLCRGTIPKAGPPFPNIILRSLTSSSGHSYAAKWPPFSCSDSNTTYLPLNQLRAISECQLWISITLAYYRGMMKSSFGKKEYPVGILTSGSQDFTLDFINS